MLAMAPNLDLPPDIVSILMAKTKSGDPATACSQDRGHDALQEHK